MANLQTTEAHAWLAKSWRDLETVRRAVTGSPPLYDMAVYHCQQCAEKAVKAFLVFNGHAYEKTHDIEVLVDRAKAIEAAFDQLADAADALTPYATRFRYPNSTFAVEPLPAEYLEAEQHAQTVYDFVLNLLPKLTP